MTISFAGKITQQEYLRAQSLHRARSKVLSLAGGALLILLILALLVAGASEPAMLGSALPIIAILLLMAAAIWGLPRMQAANQWRNTPAFQSQLSGTATPQGIHFSGPHSQGNVSWEIYSHYKSSPDMVLLYQSPNLFNMFPRALFANDADWEGFVGLVQKNVARR